MEEGPLSADDEGPAAGRTARVAARISANTSLRRDTTAKDLVNGRSTGQGGDDHGAKRQRRVRRMISMDEPP